MGFAQFHYGSTAGYGVGLRNGAFIIFLVVLDYRSLTDPMPKPALIMDNQRITWQNPPDSASKGVDNPRQVADVAGRK